MSDHQDINLAEFLSVLIFVSEECGKVIRKVKESGGHKISGSKEDESPVTEADLIVQKTIEVCLNTLYPTLKVEGEESPESIKQKVSAVNPDQITESIKKFLTTEFLNAAQEKRRSYINEHLRKTYTESEI